MEKRTLIAFILCLLIIIYYPHYLKKLNPPASTTAPLASKEEVLRTKETFVPELPQPQVPTITTAPEVAEEELTLTTPLMEIIFSNYGATIKQLILLEYQDRNNIPLELVTPLSTINRPLAMTLSPEPIIYKLHSENYQVTCTAATKDLFIKKTFILDPNSYEIQVNIILENRGHKEIHLYQGYNVSVGTIFPGEETQANMYLSSKQFIDGRLINNRLGRPPFKKVHSGRVSWSAVKNKYFVLILKPQSIGTIATVKDYTLEEGTRGISSQITMPQIVIPAGEKHSENFLLYAGPKKYEILKNLGTEMDGVMDFGKLAPISKITLSILNFFYGIVHNYGFAIILLTILIRFLLYPLTLKSYKSMREMRKIQPHMEELRKKYKDDPKRLQKEMMLLYKEHKVNPFGGCLPMLLQMPVLIALFTSLRSAIELRGAPFILWIKDLSEPDTLFRLPNGFPINILPLFMVATFFIQQKMTSVPATTEQQQQQQKMMATIMPIFMGFIFYKMPSGLVLYFSLSTLIGIVDQYRIQKKKD